MSHRIEPGQTYRSLDPRDELYGHGPRRIKVVIVPAFHPDNFNHGKVIVETITDDGRLLRRRAIAGAQLHASPTTTDGQPRRTGYALEQQP